MRPKLIAALCLSLATQTYAQNTTITNSITGVGPKNATVNPYFCIQNSKDVVTYALEPGKSVDAATYSGSPNYAGGALRFGGCSSDNTYLGYIGVNLGAQPSVSYQPPEHVHIALIHPNYQNGNLTGEIHYTPIQPNFSFINFPLSQYADLPFVGANLSGLEFGKMIDPVVIPNLSEQDAADRYSDAAETKTFLSSGMNTMRVPVSWGFLQLDGPGKGPINPDYYDAYVKPLLETLTAAHVYTIIDLHAYMRYSEFGKEYSGCGKEGKCPDGKLVLDANAYEDVWVKLFSLMKSDHKINLDYIMLDLVNEPVDVPDDAVFTLQTSMIKRLRQAGFQGYILVEGNAWSGLHSWATTSWPSKDSKTTYTNASLFTRNNFAKAGITDLTKIIINVHQYFDTDYSGPHDQCQTNLTTTGRDGFNLTAFVDYLKENHLQAMVTEFGGGKDQESCSASLSTFLQYLQTNAAKSGESGFIGWTIWSTGHGWGDYNLRVTPNSYHMNVLKQFLRKGSR